MSFEGHDEPCYYCGNPCDALAGNPSMWPIPLTHQEDPGRVRWRHIGCVYERLGKIVFEVPSDVLKMAKQVIKEADRVDPHSFKPSSATKVARFVVHVAKETKAHPLRKLQEALAPTILHELGKYHKCQHKVVGGKGLWKQVYCQECNMRAIKLSKRVARQLKDE